MSRKRHCTWGGSLSVFRDFLDEFHKCLPDPLLLDQLVHLFHGGCCLVWTKYARDHSCFGLPSKAATVDGAAQSGQGCFRLRHAVRLQLVHEKEQLFFLLLVPLHLPAVVSFVVVYAWDLALLGLDHGPQFRDIEVDLLLHVGDHFLVAHRSASDAAYSVMPCFSNVPMPQNPDLNFPRVLA